MQEVDRAIASGGLDRSSLPAARKAIQLSESILNTTSLVLGLHHPQSNTCKRRMAGGGGIKGYTLIKG